MARLGSGPALGFGMLGLAMTLLYAFQISPVVSAACMLITAVGSFLAMASGLILHRPALKAPWRLLAAASLAFLIGVMIRPWAAEQTGPAAGAADVATLAGYALLIAGLAWWLRRRGSLERHALTDGLIVCLGAGLLALILLAIPATRITSRPALISLVAGLYPLIDVVLLLLILTLSFSTAVTVRSFRMIAFAMVMMFVGDLGYAWIGARGQLTGSALLDLPFLLSFTCFGTAALHPSMSRLSDLSARPVQAWSPPRLALIVPALASPMIIIWRGTPTELERNILLATSAALMAALLVRAVSAVRDHARVRAGLWHQATHDALTALPNRTLLTDYLNGLLAVPRSPKVPWLLFLDLDGFKLVNDHWGHDTGDQLLIEIAGRLTGLAGPEAMVARVSGDEFVVAGAGARPDAVALAEAAQDLLARPVQLPGLELVVTSSIGVVTRTDQRTAEAMLSDADTAMYRAKAAGRNRAVVFDAGMRQSVRDRVEIELALRQAIGRRQLWVAYQPINDTATDRTLGAEALLRWAHPMRGAISPAEFIPVAEETGLINEIGTWVLAQAISQVASWERQGLLDPDFRMSVNVSARQLHTDGLANVVARMLSDHQVNPARLIIEITESAMMDNPTQSSEVLQKLRGLGLGISVDDFGTGYSSLSYLSRFPVSGVKVDRAFVKGLGIDDRDQAIARAVVAMAQALDLSVVAEGVESDQQREILDRLAVQHGQGWLWGQAVSADLFATHHLARAAADLRRGSGTRRPSTPGHPIVASVAPE